jgi:hypothetical protein
MRVSLIILRYSVSETHSAKLRAACWRYFFPWSGSLQILTKTVVLRSAAQKYNLQSLSKIKESEELIMQAHYPIDMHAFCMIWYVTKKFLYQNRDGRLCSRAYKMFSEFCIVCYFIQAKV